MVDDETVAKIARDVSPWRLSRWDVAWRVIAVVGAIIAIVGTSVAISTHYAQTNTAKCINTNLGARNAPNLADKTAQDTLNAANGALARAEINALSEIQTSPRAVVSDLVAAFGTYQSAQGAYTLQREADDKARAANPVGHC